MTRISMLLAFAFASSPASALAVNVLFVSDVSTDTNIATVLSGDGHTVTVVLNDFASGDNPRLRADLSAFQAIVWSASGAGAGAEHTSDAVFTNLSAFVTAGGSVFVTGYDSIASPVDPRLIAFLGGTSSVDVPGAVGVCTAAENALTTGLVDIRGVTPSGGYSDRDALTGLRADTVSVCPTTGGASHQFTLRTLGLGRIAYVSNGQSGPSSAHVSWSTTTPAGGANAYNAALRNFVDNASETILFVSDQETDTNVPSVFRGEGAQVIEVLDDYAAGDNPTLRGPLGQYGGVVWSATRDGAGGLHSNAMVFSNLLAYATGGGHVLVIGHDAIANPADPDLVAFLGGSDAVNGPTGGTISTERTILNVGAVDLRDVTPAGGSPDTDGLSGLAPGAIAVLASASGEALWATRRVGTGTISFVSNGDPGPMSAAASWTSDGGAYHGALRNFLYGVTAGLPAIRPNGASCRRDIECTSDFCIDGVCCNTFCSGGDPTDCETCAIATGGSADGTCGALTAAAATRVVCRPSSGGCDFPETCVSSSTSCPADGLRARGFECRPQIGPCDVADACDGTSRECPRDAIAVAGVTCREPAGDCDLPEECDGVSPACPPNAYVASGEECRASSGVCDSAERCDGLSGECPPDRLAGGDVSCRGSTGPCDAPEMCDGASLECPADLDRADGVSCDDSLRCNGVDVCMAGACVSLASPCDDGDACTADSCSEAGGCQNDPIADCCRDSSQCDDGDPCTRDECTRAHTCVHDVSALCSDAGPRADAGEVIADGGVVHDAGSAMPPGDGCDCSTTSSSNAAWVLAALVALIPRRRRPPVARRGPAQPRR
jgi:MYXO-CTERM domain-containing protein